MKERLKQLRESRKLTQKEVASEIDITVSAYSNYEQGIRQPANEILIRLCKFFDVSSDYLLELTDF